ncbi:MAG: hypothetical protein ACOY0R_06765 [Chloroflexota bacterium]|jgi:hypothetical protein
MHICLNCDRTEEQVPLLTLAIQGETKHICPQCLPLLIHKPQVLAEKLPGMEVKPPAEH